MCHSFSWRTCLLFAEEVIPDHIWFFFSLLNYYLFCFSSTLRPKKKKNLSARKIKNEDDTPFWSLTKFKAKAGRCLSGSIVLEGITAAVLTAYDANDCDIPDNWFLSLVRKPRMNILSSNCQDNILVIDISNALLWVGRRKLSVCIVPAMNYLYRNMLYRTVSQK